ncbi:unnamed protein product [Allacma fusca]|nr:unnamed protein product [Allacma fusca]
MRWQGFTRNTNAWRTVRYNKKVMTHSGDPDLENHPPMLTVFGSEVYNRYKLVNYSILLGIRVPEKRNYTSLKQILMMIEVPVEFPKVTIEETVSRCNKSVFVDYDVNLDSFVPNFQTNKTAVFVKGTERFLEESVGWSLQNEKKSGGLLSKFLRSYVSESGLHRWLEFKLPPLVRGSLKYFLEMQKMRSNILALSWSSNLITSLLYISVYCVITCWIVLAAEVIIQKGYLWKSTRSKNAFRRHNSVLCIQPHL